MNILFRRIINAVLLMLLISSMMGCTFSMVSSELITPVESPIDQITLVVKDHTFKGVNRASRYGQKNYESISAHLKTRIPAIFSSNGIATKLASKEKVSDAYTLVIFPVSASYSTQSGQQLKLRAVLLKSRTSQQIWYSVIRLSTPGFGEYDAELADTVAIKLLEDLDDDNVINIDSGNIKIIDSK